MKKDLWLRLRHYHFTDLAPAHLQDRMLAMFGGADASTQAFASKLSRKLGWSRPFAIRAIDEYKKFVYLGVVSPFPVTPPKYIDQVWHEHLLFSRGYREFCRDVLQRDFDHNPELVPTDDQTQAFHEQYDATLALYETEFRVAPPVAIWGTPKFRVVSGQAAAPRAKVIDRRTASHSDDTPLYMYFSGAGSDDGTSYDSLPEFGGGGGFSGGGGDSSWGDAPDASPGADSSTSSDGGSGSGCSSGCGGGGD